MDSPRTKQRQARHITGEKGVKIVRDRLPEDWVVRDIHPDYGLDLHVEVFAPDAQDPESVNTLGEHFYIQVKTVSKAKVERVVVRSRSNVAKYDHDPTSGEPREIDVVKFTLDTATLLTVETMGPAVPVLLCLADLATERVYYVCLNDYLTKVLIPYKAEYESQGTVTLMIPTWNVLDTEDPGSSYLWLLARRGKFYAAFNAFAYQYHELQYGTMEHPAVPDEDEPDWVRLPPAFHTMARVFLKSSLRLPIWEPSGPGYWAPLGDVQRAMRLLYDHFPPADSALLKVEVARFQHVLLDTFRRADNLGRMYEELVREWRLPTALAALLDYNDVHTHNPPSGGPGEGDGPTA